MARSTRKTPARPPRGEVAAIAGGIAARLSPFVAGAGSPQHMMRRGGPAAWRETLRDEKAATALSQLLDAVAAIPWTVEPGGPARRDRIAAEDLAQQLAAVDFDTAFREMAHAVWYGYAVAEIIWQPGAGRVEIDAIRTRAPERFRFGTDGSLRLVSPTHPRGTAVPAAKFWLARMPAEHGGQPHGPGAARLCFWPIWLKRNGIRYWAVALEKFGTPTLLGKHRHNAPPDQVDLLLETLQCLAQGIGIAIPEGQEITLLEATRRSGGDHAQFCKYMDTLIVEAVLLQTATTEMGPWKGTAEVQKLVRDERVATLSRLICSSLERTVARWLTDWNHPGAAYPRVIREVAPPEDLNARAQRDEIIARMSGRRPARRYIEDTYGGEWEDAPAKPPSADPRFAFAENRGDAIERALAAELDRSSASRSKCPTCAMSRCLMPAPAPTMPSGTAPCCRSIIPSGKPTIPPTAGAAAASFSSSPKTTSSATAMRSQTRRRRCQWRAEPSIPPTARYR